MSVAVENRSVPQATRGLRLVRIGEPEDQVIEVLPEAGAVHERADEGLGDDRLDLDLADARGVGGEVTDVLYGAERRRGESIGRGQKDGEIRIGRQTARGQMQGIGAF